MKTYRYEQKYVLNYAQYREIAPVLGSLLSRDKNVGESGEYMIRSLYFDDMYHSAYEEKMDGVYARKKYRIRVYNCQDSVIHLEAKYKQGAYISKESVSLTREEYERILTGDSRFLLKRDSPLGREFCLDTMTRLLKPRVIVDYDREPYVLDEGTVRVTFDKAVRASRAGEDIFDESIPSFSAMPPDQLIMEIKFTGYLPERVRKIFKVRNMVQTSASKYCLCVDRIYGRSVLP